MLAFPLMQPGAAASHLPAGAAAALALARSNSSAMQLPRTDHAVRQLEPITAAILLLLAVGGAFVTTEAVVDALHDKSKCMKGGLHDPYCCAPPDEGACASGFEHSFVDGGVCKIDKTVCEGCQATICVPRLAHLDDEDCWRHCKSSNWTSGPCLWCGRRSMG